MPWYITLLLFLCSPLYGIVVKDKLWPKYSDWKAKRSQQGLRTQISILEKRLQESEASWTYSDLEYQITSAVTDIKLDRVSDNVSVLIFATLILSVVWQPLVKVTESPIGVGAIAFNLLYTLGFTVWRMIRLQKKENMNTTMHTRYGRKLLQSRIEALKANLK